MHLRRLVSLILFILLFTVSSAQRKLGLEADNWATELTKVGLTEVNSMGSLSLQLMETDTSRALRFLDSVEASANAKGYFFRCHFNMIKAKYLFDKFIGTDNYKSYDEAGVKRIKNQMALLYADAVDAAYHTEDDRTIGWVSFYSAKLMRKLGEISWAVMYSKNGVDLFERANYDVEPTVYTDLADLLYQVREYDESIIYARKGIEAWKRVKDDSEFIDAYKSRIKVLNVTGLLQYQKLRYDSAIDYYQQALKIATQNKDTIWTGMLLGNIGRIMYDRGNYDSASTLFTTDYQKNLALNVYNNAANAAQWAARAKLAKGEKQDALGKAREALRLLSMWHDGPFLRDTYYTLTQVYRAIGHYDSAFKYSEKYIALNDSLEKEVVTSSLAISKARLNDEMSRFNIQKINRQREKELLWRNTIIVFIIIISLLAVSIINRRLLKQKIKAEKAEQDKKNIEQEKLLMEQEITAAKEQLKMFTTNLVEKADLIEKLEEQLKGKEATAEQQAIIAALSQQTILTEDDWYKFKLFFEKVYPGFFVHLTSQFPDITLAEQRMAALIRLRLSPRQMASMLGISTDSVHKSRQRLRLRFQVEPGTNIEELVAKL